MGIKEKYFGKELNFNLCWRSCSYNCKFEACSAMKISFERLSSFNIELKLIAESFMDIVNDNWYNSKLIGNLYALISNALYI